MNMQLSSSQKEKPLIRIDRTLLMWRNSYWKYSKEFDGRLSPCHPHNTITTINSTSNHLSTHSTTKKVTFIASLAFSNSVSDHKNYAELPKRNEVVFTFSSSFSFCLTSNRKFLETSQRMAALVRLPNQSCRRQSLGTSEVWVLGAPALPLSTKLPITKPQKLPLFISHDPDLGLGALCKRKQKSYKACPSQSCILIVQEHVENAYEIS